MVFSRILREISTTHFSKKPPIYSFGSLLAVSHGRPPKSSELESLTWCTRCTPHSLRVFALEAAARFYTLLLGDSSLAVEVIDRFILLKVGCRCELGRGVSYTFLET